MEEFSEVSHKPVMVTGWKTEPLHLVLSQISAPACKMIMSVWAKNRVFLAYLLVSCHIALCVLCQIALGTVASFGWRDPLLCNRRQLFGVPSPQSNALHKCCLPDEASVNVIRIENTPAIYVRMYYGPLGRKVRHPREASTGASCLTRIPHVYQNLTFTVSHSEMSAEFRLAAG